VVPMFYTLISRSDAAYLLHQRTVEKTFGTAS
jgi:multidrug efflux pump